MGPRRNAASPEETELRAPFLPAGDRVIHVCRHDLSSGPSCIRAEAIVLEVRLLVGCRYPEVEPGLHGPSVAPAVCPEKSTYLDSPGSFLSL
jgi:hypothetical protein